MEDIFVTYNLMDAPTRKVVTRKVGLNIPRFTPIQFKVSSPTLNTEQNPTLNPTLNTYQSSEQSIKLDKLNTMSSMSDFVKTMKLMFYQACKNKGYSTNAVNFMVKQVALESGYGKNPRGEFNLGGVKWNSSMKNRKHITGPDGLEYVDFNSLQDFVNFEVDLLHNIYKADTATTEDEYIDRLHGDNPGKRNYSASKSAYKNTFSKMTSINKYLA